MSDLVRVLTAPCDGGQCGGEVTLVTDGDRRFYAATATFGDTGYVPGDGSAELLEGGDVAVDCGSVSPRTLNTCTGNAVFGVDEVMAAPLRVDAQLGSLLA